MRNGLRKISSFLNIGMDKYLPESIVLAWILTIITFVAGVLFTDSGFLDMIIHWGSGFWDFLAFSMQMTLIIAIGTVVASAPSAKRFLIKICSIPKTAIQGVVFTAIISAGLGWISWGLGLVAGGIVARNVAQNIKRIDYKLLVAVAYSGAITTGLFGISGSEFLLVNTPGHFLEDLLGLIPLTETVFEPSLLLAQFLGLILAVPLLSAMMHPDPADTPEMDKEILERFEREDADAQQPLLVDTSDMVFADKINNTPIFNYMIGISGLIYVGYWFATKGFDLNLDIMNFILLMFGILLHRTPSSLLAAAEEGVKSAFGVVIQFPFYAGIQGMMEGSGLVAMIANFFASISTVNTFHYWNYIAMSIVNFFVPSSGGIFMIAGEPLGRAALELGVDPSKFVISFTAGETIGNIIQPFWAIPLLGIAGLKMKDIMGYTIMFFVVLTAIFFGVWAIMW